MASAGGEDGGRPTCRAIAGRMGSDYARGGTVLITLAVVGAVVGYHGDQNI